MKNEEMECDDVTTVSGLVKCCNTSKSLVFQNLRSSYRSSCALDLVINLASTVVSHKREESRSFRFSRFLSFSRISKSATRSFWAELMDLVGIKESNNEDWMSLLPEKLWDVALTNLSIPGSHDAMSYCLDITSPLLRSESDTFRMLDKVFCCLTRPAIYRWATTQVENIVDQLTAGIRYFDLRIAHKQNDASQDLHFTHVIYTHATVLETLQSVAFWLDSHPKEIIILACSHFEGMDHQRHEDFIYSLKKLFGSKLCPRNEALLTLRNLWTLGYQVLLSYEDHSAVRHKELWPSIPYLWANKPNADELLQYLEWQKQLGRAGLNLTSDKCFIASHPRESLQTLSVKNWECLRRWLEDQKPGPEASCLNIIAGDFIGIIPFCSLVISLNKKLL